MRARLVFALFVVALSGGALGCGQTTTPYDVAIAAGKRCTASDTCVVAGGNACRCPVAVRASSAEEVNRLAREGSADAGFYDCNGAVVRCRSVVNPRCEAAQCVADLQ